MSNRVPWKMWAGLVFASLFGIFLVLGIGEMILRGKAERLVVTYSEGVRGMGAIGGKEQAHLTHRVPGDWARAVVPNLHVTIKNHHYSGRDILMETNSLGFRGPELREKTKDLYRILFLGDSVTWADGVQDGETWVRLTEKMLNEGAAGRTFEGLNAGTPDVGTTEETRQLEEVADKVNPDLVVLVWYLNDSRPPWGFPNEIGGQDWLRAHSLLADFIYRRLALDKFISERTEIREFIPWQDAFKNWKKDHEVFLKLAKFTRLDWGAAWQDSSWKTVDGQFQKLASVAANHHLNVTVLITPVMYQVYSDYFDDLPQRKVSELAAKHGFSSFDLLPSLREKNGEQLFYDWCHYNEAGNRLVAELVTAHLKGTLQVSSLKR